MVKLVNIGLLIQQNKMEFRVSVMSKIKMIESPCGFNGKPIAFKSALHY